MWKTLTTTQHPHYISNLHCGCSKTVWRLRDRIFDDRCTNASVNPSPSTVNTPSTHKSRSLHTKYQKCSGKALFQKKCKFEGLLFVWFRWKLQVVFFFAHDCSTPSSCWLSWEAISLYICNEIDWCMWQTLFTSVQQRVISTAL